MQSAVGSSEVDRKEPNDHTGSSPPDRKEPNDHTGSSPPDESDSTVKENTESSLSDEDDQLQDENNCSSEVAQNQLVPFDAAGVVHAPEPLNSQPPSTSRKDPSRVIPSVGAFTVQCANCFQWRLIPSKEIYEEIRENILEQPFYCERAQEWKPGVSCDEPGDIQQDNSRLWAIDKPSIARPPTGWQRLLHIRGEGSSKFADVYYVAPAGKRFRSLVEIQKYFAENPELTAGINISQFSFQIPKPLQEDYVKKRPSGIKSLRQLESGEASLLETANPSDSVDLPLGQPESSPLSFETPVRNNSDQSAKKRAKKSSTQGNTQQA